MKFIILFQFVSLATIQCGRVSSFISSGSRYLGVKGRNSVGPKNIVTPALQKLSSDPAPSKWAKASDTVTFLGKIGMFFAGTGTLMSGVSHLITGQSEDVEATTNLQVRIYPHFFVTFKFL